MQQLKKANTVIEAYRQLFNIPQSDELVVIYIKGRRNQACSRECNRCRNYHDVCFPAATQIQRTAWSQLVNKLCAKEASDEGVNIL